MSGFNRQSARYRTLVGIMLIAVGLLFFVDRVIGLDVGGFERWWPLILIGIGLWKLSEVPAGGRRGGGMVMVLLGSAFLVKPVLRLVTGDLDFIDDFRVWPLFIVAIGAAIIWGALWPSRRLEGDKNDDS